MAGIASRRSLEQYESVARMRMQMLTHSVRTGRGQLDAFAQFSALATYLFLGTVFAVAFGVGAYHIVASKRIGEFDLLPWGALLMWQLTPIMAISFREEHDISGLARYPLGFGAYYILFLFFGLFDLSTIFGMASLTGIAVGTGLARASLLPPLLCGLALFAVFNVLLNRAIFAWLNRWLAQRRTREILGAIFFLIFIGAELMNPAVHAFHGHLPGDALDLLMALKPLDRALPPGLIAGAVVSVAPGHLLNSAGLLTGMLGWTILPGALLAVRLRAQYRGESLSEAGAPKTEAARGKAATSSGWVDVTGPLAAVMVKELRYLMRNYQLLYGLAAPLLLMLIFTGSPRHPNGGIAIQGQFLYPVAVLYAFLGLTRLIFNSLGTEGPGLQFYFTSPVPFRKVMLAKNLFHLGLLTVEIAVLWIIAVFRAGPPTGAAIAVTLCAMTFAVPVNFVAANLISLQVPYRMTQRRFGRPQGATSNNLLSLVTQLVVGGTCALVYFATDAFVHPWLAAGVFLVMAAFAGLAYRLVLRRMDTLARHRIEPLLADLARASG